MHLVGSRWSQAKHFPVMESRIIYIPFLLLKQKSLVLLRNLIKGCYHSRLLETFRNAIPNSETTQESLFYLWRKISYEDEKTRDPY